MKNGGLWIKCTITLAVVALVGVGTWAAVSLLDAGTFKLIVGFLLALAAVVIAGLLFVAKDVVQAYLIRRAIREDDMDEMRKMAFVTSLQKGGGAGGHVSLSLPAGMGTAPQLMPPAFDGRFRDATVIDAPIEVE